MEYFYAEDASAIVYIASFPGRTGDIMYTPDYRTTDAYELTLSSTRPGATVQHHTLCVVDTRKSCLAFLSRDGNNLSYRGVTYKKDLTK